MSRPGFGGMVNRSFENVGGEHLQAAKGKTISDLALVDDVLSIGFNDGTKISFRDEGQSCCESRYMQTDDELKDYVGAQLLGAELKEAPSVEADYDCHEVQFLEIQTSLGALTMASHVEHNGYYGGFAINITDQ